MSFVRRIRRMAGIGLDARIWYPNHARLLLRDLADPRSGRPSRWADDEHLHAALGWLARAQDASSDGGVAGRYSLTAGWSSSYPETTGYIVPTLLAAASEPGCGGFHERAERAIGFLLRLQLPDGGFPGGEVAENTTRPSVFNTAQILSGLVAWYRATGDPRSAEGAGRAATWLVAQQDDDGAWRRHVYNDTATTYTAHASCWLAEAGLVFEERPFQDAARRHVEWVLSHVDRETGWVDLAGFDATQHGERLAFTHTIAYTLWGILMVAELLDLPAGVRAVRRAGRAAADLIGATGWLPGVLDWRWHGRSDFACVTGTAQMALVWLRLHGRDEDTGFLEAALRAIDSAKGAQVMLRGIGNAAGAIPGSHPLWGAYLPLTYPNWATKYFADALFAKRAALSRANAAPEGP